MKRLLILLFLQTAFGFINAQTLSLETCRQKALEHNKSLSSAKMKLEQTKYDSKSYKANFLPQVNLIAADIYSTAKGDIGIDPFQLPITKLDPATGSYHYDVTVLPDGSYIPNSYLDFPGIKEEWKVKNVFSGSISLLEPLYAGGKISTAYNMSKIGVNMASENVRLTEQGVVVNTDEAYILAVKAKQLGEVARSYKEMLLELKKNVEAALKQGMVTRNDLMKVQVKLNEAELSIQKAENGHRLACMNLCHVIGIPLDSSIDVDDNSAEIESISETAIAAGIANGIELRPEYAILSNKTELARHNVKITKSEIMPNVLAGAAYSYANGLELAGKKLIDGGSASVGVMVKVPIDLFGGGTNKVRSAKAAYQIAQLEQQDLSEKMLLELAQCANNVNESYTELSLCKTSLEQAAENMRLSKQQYEVGFEPLANYLEAQALWQQAGANLVQSRCQYFLSLMKYRKASGASL